jgi:hypothetical protein
MALTPRPVRDRRESGLLPSLQELAAAVVSTDTLAWLPSPSPTNLSLHSWCSGDFPALGRLIETLSEPWRVAECQRGLLGHAVAPEVFALAPCACGHCVGYVRPRAGAVLDAPTECGSWGYGAPANLSKRRSAPANVLCETYVERVRAFERTITPQMVGVHRCLAASAYLDAEPPLPLDST